MRPLYTIWNFIGRYKYVITVSFFLVLVCFAGDDCLLANYRRHLEIGRMRDDLQEYRRRYERDSVALVRLENDPKEAEHIAREVYYMKRQGEDVYVFVEEKASQDTVR